MSEEFVDRRAERRGRTLLGGRVIFNERRSTLDCVVRDMAEHGARLRFSSPAVLPEYFELRVDGRFERRRAHRIWVKDRDVGIAFE